MAKQEKEIERWVTMNGVRVPIYKDGSIGGPKELRDKIKAKDKKVQQLVDSGFKSKEKSKEGKSSFDKARDHETSNLQNAKENVDMLKEQLKKHPNDMHTAEIKARLKKAQAEYKKLQGGDTSDSNFKTAKEHDAKNSVQKKSKKKSWMNKSEEPDEKKTNAYKKDKELEQQAHEADEDSKEWWAQRKASKDIAKNEDIKEKQIAANKKEKEAINKQTEIKKENPEDKWRREYIEDAYKNGEVSKEVHDAVKRIDWGRVSAEDTEMIYQYYGKKKAIEGIPWKNIRSIVDAPDDKIPLDYDGGYKVTLNDGSRVFLAFYAGEYRLKKLRTK